MKSQKLTKRSIICGILSCIGMLLLALSPASAQTKQVKNILLVHGALVDGSGWEAVYNKLTAAHYHVTIVQHSNTSLEDDVAAVNRAISKQDGPVILVGHSWGGTIIT